jgi:hypothetical protein
LQSGIATSVRMRCSEYVRLRQHYEAALRRWAQLGLSAEEEHKEDFVDTTVRLAVKQKAFEERNAAYVRIALHERNCRICNHRRKTYLLKWPSVTDDNLDCP